MIIILPITILKLCIQAFLLLILLFFQCSGDKAVESWYDEIKDHQFGKEPNSMGTGTNQILFKGVLTFTMHKDHYELSGIYFSF